MVRDTPPSQDASTHQIWNSYLKEYRRYGPDTKAGRTHGRTDGRTVRLLYASQSSFGGIKKLLNRIFILLPGSCHRVGLGCAGWSKTLVWGFGMAPHRLRVLVTLGACDKDMNPHDLILSILHSNIRSIPNKLDYITVNLLDFDILCFSEANITIGSLIMSSKCNITEKIDKSRIDPLIREYFPLFGSPIYIKGDKSLILTI